MRFHSNDTLTCIIQDFHISFNTEELSATQLISASQKALMYYFFRSLKSGV